MRRKVLLFVIPTAVMLLAMVSNLNAAVLGDVRGLVALDAATVPEVSRVLGKLFRCAGDAKAISNLFCAATVGVDDPAQAWRAFVNTERVDEIFTT